MVLRKAATSEMGFGLRAESASSEYTTFVDSPTGSVALNLSYDPILASPARSSKRVE